MKLLHLDSSPLGIDSVSRRLGAQVVATWRQAVPTLELTYVDLAADPPPHLSGALLQALRPAAGAAPAFDQSIQRELGRTEALIEQFLAADALVIGAPMYNYAVPSQLKAWIDRVAQANRTFRYTANGPQGLAGEKQVVVVSSRGGLYANTPAELQLDHQESYLRAILAFMGITRVRILRAEGLSMGPDPKKRSIDKAMAAIAEAIKPWPADAPAAAAASKPAQ